MSGLERPLSESARAKINLTLRVRGRRSDGYHDLDSIVAFAGCADALTLDPSRPLGLDVAGPMAAGCGDASGNLVLKAAQALAARVPALELGHFVLDKQLPVAAGIGGGSADAAGALRLLARANALPPGDPRILEAARAIGADVPVCLSSRACVMRGIGDEIAPVSLPPLPCVLVNPRRALATADVFAGLGLAPGQLRGVPSVAPAAYAVTLEMIRSGRNDLEDVAIRLEPAIGEVLAALRVTQGLAVARMSGSGTTCFALYGDRAAAQAAADALRLVHPAWWVWSGEVG